MRIAIPTSQCLSVTLLPSYWKYFWRLKVHTCYISPINRHNCYGNFHISNTHLKGLHKGKKKILIIQNHYFSYFVYIHLHLFIESFGKNWEALDCCICAVCWDCSCSECESVINNGAWLHTTVCRKWTAEIICFHVIPAQNAHLAFKQNIVNGLFLQTIAVVPFSEVLPPKLKQFCQIHFAVVEGVCVLTILTLVIHPVFMTWLFWRFIFML